MHRGIGLVEIDVAGFQRELAAIGHRVARVQREIEDRCRELVRIDQRRPGVRRQQRRDLDLLAQRRVQQFCRLQHQRIDVDLARLQRLLARKGEQMLGELRAALGGFVDQIGDRDQLRLVGDGLAQHPDGPGDDRQDIVEVMGHAAG